MERALAAHHQPVLLYDRLPAITVPTLVTVGLYDRNVGVDMCRDVACRIPHARFELFQHSAHFPEIEESERYARVVRAFIEG